MSPESFPINSQEDNGQMTIWDLEGINDKPDGNEDGTGVVSESSDSIKENINGRMPRETVTTLGHNNAEKQGDPKKPSKSERIDYNKWYENPVASAVYEVLENSGGMPLTNWQVYSRVRKRHKIDTNTGEVSRITKKCGKVYKTEGGRHYYSGWNTEKYPPKPVGEPEVPNDNIVQDPETGKYVETTSERREDWWNVGPIMSPSDAYHRQELDRELKEEKRREEEEQRKRREQENQSKEE